MSDSIQAINHDTVHRICSGQVVLSLAIAVKELVENSLDAGATIIDIRLKEYGSELIEVSDNGNGVLAENFQALTLKHYTSKIKQFDDLAHLSTLGFRGEALSSLCALSDLTIITKHTSAENASKITYDKSGKITTESLSAREPGTTVILENLFSTLPVRRKEFIKNLKREFNKMCQLLYAYCLVSNNVKISCTNSTSKGAKNTVVATAGLSTVKDNIVNVFGAKQTASLIEVELVKPDEQILAEFGLNLVDAEDLQFTFDFFVSSVTHGSGRSSNDRQFFYINSRPCEPTTITRLVNNVYKQFNNNQYPFVYLNVSSNSYLVDINVTPDKRQVFLEKEKVLLATIKASLNEAFKHFPSTFQVQNLELTQNTTIKDYFELDENLGRGLKRGFSETAVKKGGILEKFKKRSKTENNRNNTENLDSFVKIATQIVENESKSILGNEEEDEKVEEIKIICNNTNDNVKNSEVDKTEVKECEKIDAKPEIPVVVIETNKGDETNKNTTKTSVEITERIVEKTLINDDVTFTLDSTVRNPSNYKTITVNITLKDIKESLKKKKMKQNDENNEIKVRFRSEIAPGSNKSAEEELQKQINKTDFKRMSIVGQFNLGFIITKLDNDLFIVDQHASDEKYNFEDLQANTVMDSQILVNPKPLELTAGNETLLIENLEMFKKNGFNFKIDDTAPCTKKISLTAVPLSKNMVFGKDDIDEMLFILQHANHIMVRPTRFRAMFASRACRKSIMIGKSLSRNDMRRVIDHMGEIEQPWNCPHGRPTMRHLINLDLIAKNE